MKTGNQTKGFSLVELMIVVAVVGILSAIAYPSYQEHLRKSRRAEAQSLLMTIADRQQQFLLDTRSYAGSIDALHIAPPASVTSHYDLTLSLAASSVPAFTVTAAPLGGQLADKCGTLTLTNTGAKGPATCW